MNAINTQKFLSINEAFSEVEYFMSYMRESLISLLLGDISLQEFTKIADEKYTVAQGESDVKDLSYERGDYGRPGIMDGGPNEVQYFKQERDRCIEILNSLGIQ